ncbi:uncharacterized serine-rich protein-like protein [Tanacetum coccineum]
MGGCLSSVGGDSVTVRSSNNSAFVISPKGDLRPYSTPVFVSEVLDQMEEPSNSASFFVCNSDNLSYDQHIRALDAQHELDAGQIYFVLPISKLRDRLSASELAALAVKASVALNSKPSSSSKSSKGFSQQKRSNSYKKKSKISPFVVMETSKINVIIDEEAADRLMLDQKQQPSLGVSRSGSIRKMQRYSSRKARLAVRSFRLRLSTIYEAESSSDQSHSHKLY